jgi:cell division protein FtsI/penicillin-binding protein 2
MVKDMKLKYYQVRSIDKIPLLNALWLESYSKRYYQYWSFLSNVLWFVDQNNNAFYGIEKFFDISLRWKDWKIIWRSSSWIGPVWANDFQIEDAQNWNDVYLTIDVWIQKEVETLIKKYNEMFKTDSISVLIYDPFDWSVKASANYPSFDPNNYNTAFQLTPLWPENANLIDNSSYVDVPVYINTWWEYKLAKTFERVDTSIPKYITKNIYWPQVLVDKNISMAYEPWSIFKAFTVWIWLDTDEMRFYDLYNDPWKVKVWQFEIKNADKACLWDWNFLHAFVYSCNVWMVRIAQKMGKDVFYNYLDKLWFGKLTNIELADEDEWFIEWVTSVSDARYFNNVFWQWLLATPIQIAAWYASLLNWGYYVQPTIIKWTFNSKTNIYYPNNKKIIKQIFRPETSDAVKEWLFNVLDQNAELKLWKVPWYRLWWKSWTSQISYKWKYQNWIWWTNGSFVWIVTTDDPKYVVVIQLRRPRSNLRWWLTAWKIFWDIAKFLLNYSMIEKPIK